MTSVQRRLCGGIIREGRQRLYKEVIFDHKKYKALYIDHREGNKKEVDILENTFDPLSSLYYIRTLNIEVGKSVFINIFDSKKMWNVEVQVLKKEKAAHTLGYNHDSVGICLIGKDKFTLPQSRILRL